MTNLWAYVRLTRPANILTAIADILLGFAAAGAVVNYSLSGLEIDQLGDLFWLVLATVGLYGGGVTLNDVFDAALDRVERPERPIPSGKVSEKGGTLLGIFLLIGGVVAAANVSPRSAFLAGLTALAAVVYDAYGKHYAFWGPLNMGACRGLNVLLGMSVFPLNAFAPWLALIPVLYIGAVTTVSRGEVHGGNQRGLWLGFGLYLLVVMLAAWVNLMAADSMQRSIPFLILFIIIVFPPLGRAIRSKEPAAIGKAVKAGVLALIVLDATLAVGFAGWLYGLTILLLLPLSRWLARSFAVT